MAVNKKENPSVEKLTPRHSALPSPKPLIHAMKTHAAITEQVEKIVKQADKYEVLLNKITYCLGVLCFGLFCYLLGSIPQDIPRLYCLFFIFVVPLRWIYYRIKKWHYYLLDFCYYANAIFVTMLLFFPRDKRLFMLCFSFSEGPLAWALIVWRCSLVFNSIDKTISVLIHLLPGTVFFILRWWDTNTFPFNSTEDIGALPVWPVVNSIPTLWLWLFCIPLMVYCIWQALYFAVVEVIKRQRILRDPEIMTSYRELKRKAERANNIWWYLSGLLGAENRVYMYCIIQAVFTIATLAFTVPLFKFYRLHIGFEIFKISATVWNGGRFVFEVMPRQAVKKAEMMTKDCKEKSPESIPSLSGCTTSLERGIAEDSTVLSNMSNLDTVNDEKLVSKGGRASLETPLQSSHTTSSKLEDKSEDAVTTLRLLRSMLGNYQSVPRMGVRTPYNNHDRRDDLSSRAAKVACAS